MLLGFKKQFVKPIQIGTKVFTMREKRKVEPKIGETLYMYTGLRTANCSLISNKEKLISTQDVQVEFLVDVDAKRKVTYLNRFFVNIDGVLLDEAEHLQFVQFDEIETISDFESFWMKDCKDYKGVDSLMAGPYRWCHELVMYHWTDLRY